jgi:hypothetical protein
MTAPVQTRTDHLAGSQVATSVQAPTAALAVPPSPGFLNIKQSYLEALEALGYTESEARFLYVVATHSGYFVARQFLAFTCGHWDKRATTFWHKLHTKKHARTEYFPMVYHVFSRRLYRQIPMFLDSNSSSPSPVVTFTYLQGPEASLTEFVHHLQAPTSVSAAFRVPIHLSGVTQFSIRKGQRTIRFDRSNPTEV